jgi:hypothetical protein
MLQLGMGEVREKQPSRGLLVDSRSSEHLKIQYSKSPVDILLRGKVRAKLFHTSNDRGLLRGECLLIGLLPQSLEGR